MDLLWSRLLLPCMDVEQKNCYFCICHLNGLLILPSPVRAVTERGQEVRANPASTQGRTQSEKLLRFTIFNVEISEVMQRDEGCLVFPDSPSFLWWLFLKDRKTLGSLVFPSIFLSQSWEICYNLQPWSEQNVRWF